MGLGRLQMHDRSHHNPRSPSANPAGSFARSVWVAGSGTATPWLPLAPWPGPGPPESVSSERAGEARDCCLLDPALPPVELRLPLLDLSLPRPTNCIRGQGKWHAVRLRRAGARAGQAHADRRAPWCGTSSAGARSSSPWPGRRSRALTQHAERSN